MGEFDGGGGSGCGSDGDSLRRQLLRCKQALAKGGTEGTFARLEMRRKLAPGGCGNQHARLLREGGEIGGDQHFVDLEAESLESIGGSPDSTTHSGHPIDRPEALGQHGDASMSGGCQ